MSKLCLYLDDAGKADQPVFAMGGFLAFDREWKQFAGEWQSALDEAEMDEFHATDFFSRRGKHNKKGGRYEDWPDAKHKRFARRFAAIAEKHTKLGVGRGIDMSAYYDLVYSEPIFRGGTPHNRFTPIMLCSQMCLEHEAKRIQQCRPGEQVAVVFEQGDGVGEMIEWCRWLQRHTSWAQTYCSFTPDDKSSLPLQAADLLAHETWRHIKEHVTPTGRPLRKSLERLLKGKRISMRAGTRNQFVRGIEQITRFTQVPRV